MKLITSVLILFMLALGIAGCASGRKSYTQKRGLMLLENTQLGRNKGYYSKHKAKQIDHSYKKIVKKRKFI